MSRGNEKADVVLDFRHENGINWYLIKDKRSGEISWVMESKIPKRVESSLVQVRQRKGELARAKVFGAPEGLNQPRKVQLSSPARGQDDAGSCSSSSEASSDSGDDDVRGGLAGGAGDSADSGTVTGLLSTENSRVFSETVDNFVAAAGCRGLPGIGCLGSESDMRLNEMFVGLLYAKGVASRWHREILDLGWTLLITSPPSEERNSALEQLCLLVSRLSDHDTIVSKSLDELLAETTVEEFDGVKYSVATKLSDLVSRGQVVGIDSLTPPDASQDAQMEDSPQKDSKKGQKSTGPRFSYIPPGKQELDDEGIIELVYKIYEWRNREKLAEVPGIIEKYRSQIPVLFVTLMKKYNVVYSDLNDPRVFVPISEKGQKIKEKLTEIFTAFEPSRLVDVDQIVGNYVDKSESEIADYISHLEESYSSNFGRISERVSRLSTSQDPSIFGLRALIEEALAVGNPERLAKVDLLLKKYRGREHFLYLAICDKYALSVEESRFRAAIELREKSVELERKSRMRKVLTNVYERYNKDKLAEIDRLVDKYNVLELFDLLARKYNIGLDEKVSLLLSTGVHTEVDVDFPPLFVQTLTGLALTLELNRKTPFLFQPEVSKDVMELLCNPVTIFSPSSAELVVQAKSSLFLAHGPSGSIPGGVQVENLLRDLIERKVTDVLRALPVSSCNVQVTAQEPEYVLPDAFLAVETGRCSCVVSVKGSPSAVKEIVSGVCEKMASFDQRVTAGAGMDPIQDESGVVAGPGAFRCFSIFSSQGTGAVFSGDFRVLRSPDSCPTLARSRIAVFAVADGLAFSGALLKRRTKCTVILRPTFVGIVGSVKHRTAFEKTIEFVSKITGKENPDFQISVARKMCAGGKPGMVLPPQIHDWSDVTYHESADDLGESMEASETERPLKLTRQTMRDSYLQGQLCMNCDETNHKPPECPIKRKVCWNCHGSHAGASCILPCRFCKGRHSWGILECVKRGAKRYIDWLKSRSCAEEKGLGAMVDDLIHRLRSNGWNSSEPGIAASIKTLTQMGVFVDLYIDMAKLDDEEFGRTVRGTAVGEEGVSAVRPVPPRTQAPALPDSQFAWMERVWLDDILTSDLIGRDPLKLITTHKGQQIRNLEIEENCRISFRGASAKEIFGGGSDPSVDVRFHAVVMADTPVVGLRVKRALIEILKDIESAVAEGRIAKPPVVEGFVFMEKIEALNDNIAQFDFMNANNGAPIEIELKNHFEFIGDLRHWLHQRGVEVELGNENSVKLPSSGKVLKTLDSMTKREVDRRFIDIFNAFFELVNFWGNRGQYWFEPFELKATGLLGLAEAEPDHENFESGQVVGLSEYGIDHFAKLLVQSGLVSPETDVGAVKAVISGLKGVIRTGAKDNRLLMYLKHPWALSSSSGTVARDVPESFESLEAFKSVLNPVKLRQCGRLGSLKDELLKADAEVIRTMLAPYNDDSAGNQLDLSELVPGDGILKRLSIDQAVPEGELPYIGYIVDWVTPQEVTDFVSGFGSLAMDIEEPVNMDIEPIVAAEEVAAPILAIPVPVPIPVEVAEEEDLNALTVNELKERLKAKDLPTTGRKADLIERIKADARGSGTVTPAAQMYKCRVELPRALMSWSELTNNLTGPGNSHFAHIKQMCPTADIVCQGTPAAALVGEARLHVQLTASNAEDYNKARSLVEDLVKAVVEVGSEICLGDEAPAVRQAAINEVRIVEIAKP
jgi:hypothetical protein